MESKYYPPHLHKCSICRTYIIVPSYPITKENLQCCYKPLEYCCAKCSL